MRWWEQAGIDMEISLENVTERERVGGRVR